MMRSYKVAPVQFLVLVVTVTIYVVLLILSFNKHTRMKPPDHEEIRGYLDHSPDKRLEWIAQEWPYNRQEQTHLHQNKPRLSESVLAKNGAMNDVIDDDKESSVSGDSAGYDQSSKAIFSHPLVNPGQKVRRIFPKSKDNSVIKFKPESYVKPKENDGNLNLGGPAHAILPKLPVTVYKEANQNIETFGQDQCRPHTNVVYIKTHKTGSSTLQNIFYRFGDERNLTFALPLRDVYIQSVREFEMSSLLPPPPGQQFNIMANHVRFFYNDFEKLMPPDTKYITIIRKSGDQFRSMYTYFVLESQYKATIEQFSLNPEYFYEKFGKGRYTRHNGRDPMLFDLGMEKSNSNKPRLVQEYIDLLDSKLDLVLILEYFYESLILLKDLLCWDLRMLVHVNNKIKVSLTPESATQSFEDQRAAEDVVKRLNRWNAGDVKLYDHFNKTLWKKINDYGRTKMAAEVAELKELCVRIEHECMNGTKIRDISRGSLQQTGLAEYVIRPSQKMNMTCRRLAMTPRNFLSHLRTKHVGQFHKKTAS